ncbi:MAG TPA: GNAT family N-acetyltransferase [Methanothrix sp.]|nr:GNAT family N-acetyltransferase [Methanothrix sp.]
MMQLKLAGLFQDLRKGILVFLRTLTLKGVNLVKQQKRKASDYIGSLVTRNWEKTSGGCITTVDSVTLPQVLQIFYSSFDGNSDGLFRRYSKIFNHIFYVAKMEDKIVGYCVYYIKPSLSVYGIKKNAVIYSIAVDGNHRGQGIGKQLLDISIQEMKSNGIDEIYLYANKKNSRAISLYTKFGFAVIDELLNICGEGEKCYKMKLVPKKYSRDDLK